MLNIYVSIFLTKRENITVGVSGMCVFDLKSTLCSSQTDGEWWDLEGKSKLAPAGQNLGSIFSASVSGQMKGEEKGEMKRRVYSLASCGSL